MKKLAGIPAPAIAGVIRERTAGAAIATVVAQAISVMISLLILRRRGLPFQFDRSDLRFQENTIRKVTSLGVPIALQDLLVGISFLVLLAIVLVHWIMAGKPMAKVNWKKAGKIAYCAAALLVLGTGMAMIMAFEGLMIPGIIVGVVGIVLGLGIIPIYKGLK